jgi:hypothetical protein
MENIVDSDLDRNIALDSDGLRHLKETRKWTMFLSVAGIVFIGFMFLIVLYASIFIGETPAAPATIFSPFMSVIPLLLICVLYFFPIYYLLQFSRYSKQAINAMDSNLLSNAMRYLKLHYRYIGILFIVFFTLYVIYGMFVLITWSPLI